MPHIELEHCLKCVKTSLLVVNTEMTYPCSVCFLFIFIFQFKISASFFFSILISLFSIFNRKLFFVPLSPCVLQMQCYCFLHSPLCWLGWLGGAGDNIYFTTCRFISFFIEESE